MLIIPLKLTAKLNGIITHPTAYSYIWLYMLCSINACMHLLFMLFKPPFCLMWKAIDVWCIKISYDYFSGKNASIMIMGTFYSLNENYIYWAAL